MFILNKFSFGLYISALFIVVTCQAKAQSTPALNMSPSLKIEINCDDVNINFIDDPSLTPDERMALMDAALNRSLSKFDACQTDPTAKSASSSETTSISEGVSGAVGSANSNSPSDAQEDSNNSQNSGSSASDAGSQAASAATKNGGMSGTPPRTDPMTNSGASQGVGTTNSVAASDMSGTEEPVRENEQLSTGVSGWTSKQPDEGLKSGNQSSESGTGSGDKVLHNGKLPDDIPPADNDSVLEAQIRKAAINEKDPEIQKKLWNEYRKYKGLPQVDQ